MGTKRFAVFIPEGATLEVHFRNGTADEREESLLITNGDMPTVAIKPYNKNATFDAKNGVLEIEPT